MSAVGANMQDDPNANVFIRPSKYRNRQHLQRIHGTWYLHALHFHAIKRRGETASCRRLDRDSEVADDHSG
jgi:hypothetical protein